MLPKLKCSEARIRFKNEMHFLSDIVRYSYSPEELLKCIRAEDFWHFKLTKKELPETIREISSRFLFAHGEVRDLKVGMLGGNRVYFPDDLQDVICLRRTNDIIKK